MPETKEKVAPVLSIAKQESIHVVSISMVMLGHVWQNDHLIMAIC